MNKLVSTLVIASLGLSSVGLNAETVERKKMPEPPESTRSLIENQEGPSFLDESMEMDTMTEISLDIYWAKLKKNALEASLVSIEAAEFDLEIAKSFGFTGLETPKEVEALGNVAAILVSSGVETWQVYKFLKYLWNDPVYAKAYAEHKETLEAKLANRNRIEKMKTKIQGKRQMLADAKAALREFNQVNLAYNELEDLRPILSLKANDVKVAEELVKIETEQFSIANEAYKDMLDTTDLDPNIFTRDPNYSKENMERIRKMYEESKLDFENAKSSLEKLNSEYSVLEEKITQLEKQHKSLSSQYNKSVSTHTAQLRALEEDLVTLQNHDKLITKASYKSFALANAAKLTKPIRYSFQFLKLAGVSAVTTPLFVISMSDLSEKNLTIGTYNIKFETYEGWVQDWKDTIGNEIQELDEQIQSLEAFYFELYKAENEEPEALKL